MDSPRPSGFDDQYIPGGEAAALLGVKRETLYSYASRGRVRTVPGRDARSRLYHRGDLERLVARSAARAGHGAVAAAALRWGEPVLDTAITQIGPEGPKYRGVSAVDLVRRRATYEMAAERLWGSGAGTGAQMKWEVGGVGMDTRRVARLLPEGARPIDALALAVVVLAAGDPRRFDLDGEALFAGARTLIPRLAASSALARDPAGVEGALARGGIAAIVQRALGARAGERSRAAIDAALVLCADHELNASTFTARIAASAGADLYACVAAALATLSGPRHGGMCDRVEALVAEAVHAGDAERTVRDRLRRGEAIPGFGHPLYPDGDPRATPLLAAARAIAPGDRGVRAALGVAKAMRELREETPSVDLALVALAAALHMPAGGALAMFAIGRLAGWIAHAAEQRATGHLLRPRARYVGEG